MKLTILGTGNAVVTKVYNTCFVLTNDKGEHLLVDGGGGNLLLSRLQDAGIDWKDIRRIFVTHKHIDHILGIIWMMRLITQNMNRGTYEGEATIYGHGEVIDLLKELAAKLLNKKEVERIDNGLWLVVVEDGQQKSIIGETFTFFDIGSVKAKQFGFSMTLGEAEKLTCLGDEPYMPCEEQYARDSKWLLSEAFCLYSQADIFKPYQKNHSTVKDACALAESLHVKNLILYHTEDKNIHRRKELYLKEGLPYYSGKLYVPEDLETFEL